MGTFWQDIQGQPVMLHGAMASGDLFSVLAVKPMPGRTFTAAEDRVVGN